MKKILSLIVIVSLSCIIAAIYGGLHDQLTYSISPEYYTKFKFYQFGLLEHGVIVQYPRLMVAIVGIMATWWVGFITGTILGIVGLIHEHWRLMLNITTKAIVITMLIAFITGLTGLLYGYLNSGDTPDALTIWNPYIIEKIIDHKHFEAVGYMHDFSYLGGALGILGGAIYSVYMKWQRKKLINNHISP